MTENQIQLSFVANFCDKDFVHPKFTAAWPMFSIFQTFMEPGGFIGIVTACIIVCDNKLEVS